MPDEPRPRPDGPDAPQDYEPPRVDDMPDQQPLATAADSASPPLVSDRALKRQLAAVDVDALLARVLALPIASWSYAADDPAVRHIGPMAQDFAAAFEVGEDDRHIQAVDAAGVALAAIQALAARLAAAESRIAELEDELDRPRVPATV
jgi:Chaperone of endosialidase